MSDISEPSWLTIARGEIGVLDSRFLLKKSNPSLSITFCRGTTFLTLSTSTFWKVSIYIIKRMTFMAMCLARIYSRWAITPSDIFFQGYCFQMIWINAFSISAKMIYSKTVRNLFFESFIHRSMHKMTTNDAISMLSNNAFPFPTTCFVPHGVNI